MVTSCDLRIVGNEINDLKIVKCSGVVKDSLRTLNSHIHNQCEIYVNLTGNVAFMVEDKLYPIKSKDVIITRPYEAHHCIYYSKEEHDHFCITFSCDENDEIFARFFRRNAGEGNLISLSQPAKETLYKICESLSGNESNFKKCFSFLKLIELLSENEIAEVSSSLPQDIECCVAYIKDNFMNSLTIQELAEYSHSTVNTLERHFKKYLGVSPHAFIQNYRLAYAVAVLENGGTVSEAAEKSGFTDLSHFIRLFRQKYAKTPLQFRKNIKSKI